MCPALFFDRRGTLKYQRLRYQKLPVVAKHAVSGLCQCILTGIPMVVTDNTNTWLDKKPPQRMQNFLITSHEMW